MDSAELTGWIAYERYQAAREQARQAARGQRALTGGL